MRRLSVFLAVAAIFISVAVGYTLLKRVERARHAHFAPTPRIQPGLDAVSPTGWRWLKSDPESGKPITVAEAESAEATHDPSTFEVRGLSMRLYDKAATGYTYITAEKALFDEGSGLLKSEGPVLIVMNVPADQDASKPEVVAKRVHVTTSGVTYETKSGKASTDQAAKFTFSEGDGQCVGVEYDPSTKVLHLKSQIALDWIGKGTAANKMHIETGDLVYKQDENKIYLSPWSKMQRQSTTVQAQTSVVTLEDDYDAAQDGSVIAGTKKTHLHEIDSDHAFGADDREGRHTDYSADKMTALFDESGNLVDIVAENHARIVAAQEDARNTVTSNRADLRFAVTDKVTNGESTQESDLHLVLADGNAVAESVPQPRPGVQIPETRILRSEHLELEMKPGGKDIQEIRTSSQAQLEFKPNRPDQSHRVIDASHLRVIYGEGSYVDTFLAWNAAVRTEKPVSNVKASADAKAKSGPPPPALTWSDELKAKFTPNTNQVATVDQDGHFRYEEGVRKASADKALLEQTINRMTLNGKAHVLDDTGSAIADAIVMNQATGDMDASGHVLSTHEPNKNQKPGTSMLDDSKAMQAEADQMRTRENNTVVHYQGHAVMWQGANRTSADKIDIDRDSQSLHASGNVLSELVDNKSNSNGASQQSNGANAATTATTAVTVPPIFTIVHAPELNYHDDTRIAVYTGGVKLIREKMTVVADQLQAFLTPKTKDNSDQSSLDHAVASGHVTVSQVLPNDRTRVGKAERCEYFTKDSKVVLNGGSPQVVDSYKGLTKGQQLTYFSDDDHLIVEGEKKQLAYTRMKKK